ncbi:zinc ribbon domain-containing protein [Streptococcus hongkongensis]|nr:hypothetical protein NC01_06155 [Streptococcus uberis]
MEKMCQSCAMPLMPKGQDFRGSNGDATKSADYCYLCYVNGHFTSPDITFAQMVALGRDGISKGKGNTIIKMLFKASYPMLLKKTKRWQNVK